MAGSHSNYVRGKYKQEAAPAAPDVKAFKSAEEYQAALAKHQSELGSWNSKQGHIDNFYKWADAQTFKTDSDVDEAWNHYVSGLNKPNVDTLMGSWRKQAEQAQQTQQAQQAQQKSPIVTPASKKHVGEGNNQKVKDPETGKSYEMIRDNGTMMSLEEGLKANGLYDAAVADINGESPSASNGGGL